MHIIRPVNRTLRNTSTYGPSAAHHGGRLDAARRCSRMAHRPARDLLRKLGARLKAIRSEATWTQEQLADAVEIAPNTISRFENGHLSLRITTLANIADALGVSLGDLLDVTRAPPPASPPPADQEMLTLFYTLDDEARELATSLVREVVRNYGAPAPRRRGNKRR